MRENSFWLLRNAQCAKKQGPAAIAERQRTQLADMVAFARTHSPYYRELYQGVPDRITDPTLLPVTSKKALMSRFNDWVTDRAVTIEQVRAFDEPTYSFAFCPWYRPRSRMANCKDGDEPVACQTPA